MNIYFEKWFEKKLNKTIFRKRTAEGFGGDLREMSGKTQRSCGKMSETGGMAAARVLRRKVLGARGGFTLMELIVTMVILAMLAAVSVGAMMTYQTYSIYKKNDEYARSIFNAAQASLARSRASGMLEDLEEELDDLLEANASGVGNQNECGIWEETRSKMYYLMISKTQYETLETAGSDTAAGLLYEILSPYLLDGNVFDASICVELDPTDGVVQGVFYCDRADSLVYGESSGSALGLGVKGSYRSEENRSYRRSNGLGYYGTDTSEAAPGSLDKLVVSSVELVNGETLDLTWTLKKSQMNDTATSDYQIGIYEDISNTEYPRLKITLKGSEGGLMSRQETNTVTGQVEFYDTVTGAVVAETELAFDCYLENGDNNVVTAHLVLDAVDLDLTDQTLAGLGLAGPLAGDADTVVTISPYEVLQTLYGSVTEDGSVTEATGEHTAVSTLTGSYSIRRLGLDFEHDIFASVQASNTSYRDSKERTSNKENPLFADLTEEKGETASGEKETPKQYTAEIANARHLFNASFEEEAQAYIALSETTEEENETEASGSQWQRTAVYRSMNYLQTEDFAWSSQTGESSDQTAENSQGILENGSVYASTIILDENGNATSQKDHRRITEVTDPLPAFHSFELLHSDTVYDGNGKTITGLVYDRTQLPELAAGGNDGDGESSTSAGGRLGFIRNNCGTVKDLTLADCQVRGATESGSTDSGAGAAAGENGAAGSGAEAADSGIGATAGENGAAGNGTGEATGAAEEAVLTNGIDYVGAFCGKLSAGGTLVNCVVFGGTVTGRSYVGGLAGAIDQTDASAMEAARAAEIVAIVDSKNSAQVGGYAYVGGIAGGTLTAADQTETVADGSWNTVRDAENTGAVRSVSFTDLSEGQTANGTAGAEQLPSASSCFGGIVGLSRNLRIEECQSAPQTTEAEREALEDLTVEAGETAVFRTEGNFVGGIAGYSCQGSVIANCSTGEGYIIGRNFVGGIVGMYEGADEARLLNGEWDGTYCENQAYVIGENFVGGITAVNADIPEADAASLFLKLDYEAEDWIDTLVVQAQDAKRAISVSGEEETEVSTIRGWINRGVVTGSGSYVGGITGFNTGLLLDCQCEVNTAAALEAKRKIAASQGYTALYSGGLAGYNNGTIMTSTGTPLHVVSVVSGQSFVGGLVGYQDNEGVLKGYYLDGGYIEGTSFVGGAIGLNYSEDVLQQETALICNPNVVTGDYFTGGILGANFAVIDPEKTTDTLRFTCNTDNFLGTVNEADEAAEAAFTGGFIGANMLLQLQENEGTQLQGWQETEKLTKLLLELLPKDETGEQTAEQGTTMDYSTRVRTLTDLMDTFEVAKLAEVLGINVTVPELELYMAENNTAGAVAMTISGTEESHLVNRLNSVSGGVYVGGILGFNSRSTSLTLSYIDNLTAVTANRYITDAARAGKYKQGRLNASGAAMTDSQGNVLTDDTVRFSYAGGIIGLVTDHTVVDHCGNRQQGRVSGSGTYRGSIAEVNEGTITNCSTGSTGSMTSAYVGGIAGINGIREAGYSENGSGTPAVIAGCTVDGIIRGTSYVGGITAENYGIIEAYGSGENIAYNIIEGTVSGSGSYVGGVAGKTYAGAAISGVRITGTGSVGVNGNCVGGVAGGNTGAVSQISDVESAKGAVVTGNKNVGGIIGRQENPSAHVGSAVGSTTAGGSTAGSSTTAGGSTAGSSTSESSSALEDEDSTITEAAGNLVNRATVTAYSGNAGGIVGTAETALVLDVCENYGNVEAQLTGDAGGIISLLNEEDSELTNCISRGDVVSRNGRAGGITAVNNGLIAGCTVGGTSADTVMQVEGRSYTGGICGENGSSAVVSGGSTGSIDSAGSSSTDSVSGSTGSTGAQILASQTAEGETALNSLQNLLVTNTEGGSSTCLGGVSGVNRGVVESIDCTTGANVTVRMQSAGSSVGGLTGINEGADSRIGAEDASEYMEISGIQVTVGGMNGNVGGIAGENEGQILSVTVSTPETMDFVGGSGYGYGGIAGINREGGRISRCRIRVQMTVVGDANAIASMGGAAGINEEDADVEQVQVLAGTCLECSNSAYLGGIVGMNLGTVADCLSDTRKTEVNQTEEVKNLLNPGNIDYSDLYENNRSKWNTELVDRDKMVYVINNNGLTGGIAGVIGNPSNKKEGLHATVSNCSTGENWYVVALSHATDNACGGIIGYSYGVESVTDAINYAAVVKRYKETDPNGANSVGGILGRWENEEGAQAVLENCENFGTLDARRAGGMIGQVKYNGAVLRGCKNWGNIYSTTSESCAGMIASFYSMDVSQTVLAEDCGNYGDIFGASAGDTGGFFGTDNHGKHATSGYVFTFRNCVNAGDVCLKKTDKSCGFAGSNVISATFYYERCRNFGSGYSDFDKTTYNSSFAGISCQTNATLVDCFAVANPLTSSGALAFIPLTVTGTKSVLRSYYLMGASGNTSGDFSGLVKEVNAAFNGGHAENSTSYGITNVADGILNTDDKISSSTNTNRFSIAVDSGKFIYQSGREAYATIQLDYQTMQTTNGIEICFTYRNDQWRAYVMRVGYCAGGSGGAVTWLNESNIDMNHQTAQRAANGGLYYDSEEEMFSFYLSKNVSNGLTDRNEAATAYFSLPENTSVEKIVLEIYGEYQVNSAISNRTAVKNANYLLTSEPALTDVNKSCASNYIAVTEIGLTGIVNRIGSGESSEGDALENVMGEPLYYMQDDSKTYYRWSENGVAEDLRGLGDFVDGQIALNPNDISVIDGLKTFSGEEKWRKLLKTDSDGNDLPGSSLESIDNAVQVYYDQKESAVLAPVTNLQYAGNTSGGFNLNWNCSGMPSYYEVTLYHENNQVYSGKIYNADIKNTAIPVQSSWADGIVLTARVQAFYGTEATEAAELTLTFEYFLKNADVSLRLVNISGNASDMYQILLENYHDYERTLKEDEELVLRVWDGSDSNATKTFWMKYETVSEGNVIWYWRDSQTTGWSVVGAGGALGTMSSKGDDNESISSQVQVGEYYSAKKLVQTTAPTVSIFKTQKAATVNWKLSKLQGSSRDEQSYLINDVDHVDKYQNRLRGEFVVMEEKDGVQIPVVVSTAELDLASFSNDLTMELTNLPESFSSYMVRIYPWAGKNSVVTYHYYDMVEDASGNAVRATYTWEELFGNNGKLADIVGAAGYQPGDTESAGYLVEAAGKNEDGEDIYYLINSEIFKGIDGDGSNTVQNTQIQYCYTGTDGSHWVQIDSRSTPENLALTQNGEGQGEGSAMISWQMPGTLKTGENSDYRKNSFEVILTGYDTRESTEGVQIYRSKVDSGAFAYESSTGTYSITLSAEDTATWNYQKIGVEVICQGMTDSGGQLTWMPSPAVTKGEAGKWNPTSFTYLLQLPQISAPTVQSPSDKNNLVYTVIWFGVTEEQANYLDRYEVYLADAENGDVLLGTVVRDDEDQIRAELDVDLDAYEGQTIAIYVKAIARPYEGVAQYMDSQPGKTTEIQVPNRLPAVDRVILNQGYAADDSAVVAEQDFVKNGLLMTAGVSGEGADRIKTGVSFSYQAALYQLTEEQYRSLVAAGGTGSETGGAGSETGGNGSETDGAEDSQPDWKSGQRLSAEALSVDTESYSMALTIASTGEVISAKKSFGAASDGTSMTTASAEGSGYRQGSLTGLGTSDAATYLIVRFRTLSSSDISSKWSDYYLLRLPKVQLEAPKLQTGTDMREWNVIRTETLTAASGTAENGAEAAAGEIAAESTGAAAAAGQSDEPMIVDTSGTDVVQQEVENRTLFWTQQADSQASGYEVTIHPSRVDGETNPDGLTEEQKYDYEQYPVEYPGITFRITENPDTTDAAHPYVIQMRNEEDGSLGTYQLTLSDTSSGSTTWEVYLDDIFFETVSEVGEVTIWKPFPNYLYEYVYTGSYETLEGTLEEKYSMTVKPGISVTRAQNGTVTYTLILPDLQELNSLRVLATSAVEVRTMTQAWDADYAAEELSYSGEQFTASQRSQWMVRQNKNRDNDIADYQRTLQPENNWYDNVDNDLTGSNFQWINDYSVYSLDNSGNILYRYECTGDNPYYDADHDIINMVGGNADFYYKISRLPFVASSGTLASMLNLETEEDGPTEELEEELTEAGTDGGSEWMEDLIIDPEEPSGESGSQNGSGNGTDPNGGTGETITDGGDDILIMDGDGLLADDSGTESGLSEKAAQGTAGTETGQDEVIGLENLTEEAIELESLSEETTGLESLTEETVELESLQEESAGPESMSEDLIQSVP